MTASTTDDLTSAATTVAAETPAQTTSPDASNSTDPSKRSNLLEDGKSFQVVSFRLGGEEYGVDIMIVQEIILLGRITQVPEVPDHVLGVINLRGTVIPIINLRSRFGMPEQSTTDETRIVVINIAGRTVGMVVDGVNEVLRLSRDDISTTPQSLNEGGREYVQGLARLEDRLLILLDMSRLLQSRDLPPTNHN
jgi:purine-binding chemotaxis protein CheW